MEADGVLLLFQLYDRISCSAASPTRQPPSDAVHRCRELVEWLRESVAAASVSNHHVHHHHGGNNNAAAEMKELANILSKPHFKVGNDAHCSLAARNTP
jgi:hypothetical protein